MEEVVLHYAVIGTHQHKLASGHDVGAGGDRRELGMWKVRPEKLGSGER